MKPNTKFIYGSLPLFTILFPFFASANLINVMASRDPLLKEPVLNEVYSANFLEQRTCLYAAQGTPLSVVPLSRDAVVRRASTQAEERARVHMRIYECMPYAMSEIEAFISTLPNDARRKRVESLFREAKGWWRSASLFYSRATVRTLDTAMKPKFRMGYLLADTNYAWSYSNHSISLLRKVAQEYKVFDAQHFSQPVLDLLTPLKAISGRQRSSGDMVLAGGQKYFNNSLSADLTGRMQELDRLHREAGEALLCKLKTGTWCAGGRPAPVAAAEYDIKLLEAVRQYHLPIIPPFSRGAYAGLTYDQLCTVSQKIEHAHHAWVDGVIRGNTVQGFRDSWVAGLAHTLLHVERRFGQPLHPSANVDEKKLLSQAIRSFTDYQVPGVGADGTCHLDFESH